MAGSLNQVTLIGRLTRDPECRTFANGGKVAQFGLAVNEKRKDQSGQWVDAPVFVDCKAFNSQYRKLADTIEQYLKKGRLVCICGKLTLEQWEDKNGGGRRSKLVVTVNDCQFLESKPQDGGGAPAGGGGQPARQQQPARQPAPSQPEYEPMPTGGGEEYPTGGEDIPF